MRHWMRWGMRWGMRRGMRRGVGAMGIMAMAIMLVMGGAGTPLVFGAESAWQIMETEGDLFTLPTDQVDWRLAEVSDPLLPGDRLWAAPAGRAVVQGPEGLLARLDHQTQIELVQSAGSDGSRPTLSLLGGTVYVKHPALGHKGVAFALEVGHTMFRSEIPTMMRVGMLEDGAIAVAVYKGEVQIVTDAGSTWVRAGETTTVTQTAVVWWPENIRVAQRDDFDRWNEEQELRLARQEPPPDPAEPDLAQLDDYGEWVQVATYGRVWQPRVALGWQPYFYGQWVWVSTYGWTWVSAEPWGWLPGHYGQWVWDSWYGWVWTPGNTWAPAWVIWTPYEGGWAWAPYGPFGIPVSIAWHYWCWTVDVGRPGWQDYRPVGTVPPSVHRHPQHPTDNLHRPPSGQPPHRSGGDRVRNEEVARVKPVRLERGTVAQRSDNQQPSGERLRESSSPAERLRGQRSGALTASRVDPPEQPNNDGRRDVPPVYRTPAMDLNRMDPAERPRNSGNDVGRDVSSRRQPVAPSEAPHHQTETGRSTPPNRLNGANGVNGVERQVRPGNGGSPDRSVPSQPVSRERVAERLPAAGVSSSRPSDGDQRVQAGAGSQQGAADGAPRSDGSGRNSGPVGKRSD